MICSDSMNNAYYCLAFDLFSPDRVSETRKGEQVYENFNRCMILQDLFDTFCDIRGASWEYLQNEFRFYASGSNKLEDALKISKFWKNCTDDGETINSNYGRLLFHNRNAHGFTQFEHALRCLVNNPNSKKAVMTLYGPENAYISNDNPCTMFLHFLIWNDKLHLNAFMRSNDIWFGIVYDVPYFCSVLYAAYKMLSPVIKAKYGMNLCLGTYTHNVCNIHMYERNRPALRKIVDRGLEGVEEASPERRLALLNLYEITLDCAKANMRPDWNKFDYAGKEATAPAKVQPAQQPVEQLDTLKAHSVGQQDMDRAALNLAWNLAEKNAQCLKKKCGAILVDKDNRIIGTGYSGRAGEPCKVCARDAGEVFYSDGCYSVHAEMRAIHAALTKFPNTDWSACTMYTTHGPCDACMKLMDYVGIRTCVYDVPYKTNYAHYPRVAVRMVRVRRDIAGKFAL